MNTIKCLKATAACLLLCVLFFVSGMGKSEAELKDGTYEGEHSFVAVSVTIANGRIADIKMTRHGGGGEKYAAMVTPLISKMIEKQSTEVDAVSGATVSSGHLQKAVNNAFKKALYKSGDGVK